jgi:hypothetical protein
MQIVASSFSLDGFSARVTVFKEGKSKRRKSYMAVPRRFRQRSADTGAEGPSESWASMHEQLVELMKWYVYDENEVSICGIALLIFESVTWYSRATT